MEIQNTNLNKVACPSFKGNSVHTVPEKNDYNEPKLVQLNYDTAKAYAIYGIKPANNAKDFIPLKNVSLDIKKSKNNLAFCNIMSSNVDEKYLMNEKQGMTDIYKSITRKYLKASKSEMSPDCATAEVNVKDFSLACVFDTPDNIEKAIKNIKNISFTVDHSQEDFEKAKEELKEYYRENIGKNEESNDDFAPKYSAFENENSIEKIEQNLDNISFEEYQDFCKSYRHKQNTMINISLPEKMFEDEEKVNDLEKLVLENLGISGKFERN